MDAVELYINDKISSHKWNKW